jgi:hypothetical protein
MKVSVIKVIMAIAVVSGALVSQAQVESTTTSALSVRAGYYSEKQTFMDWEMNYTAPFVGLGLDLKRPLNGPLYLLGQGSVDVAYGTYSEPGIGTEDFDQDLIRVKLQGALAYDIALGQLKLDPFAGLGYRYWKRGSGDGMTPYIETWTAAYAVLGVRGEIKLADRALFGQIDGQIPISEQISMGSTLGTDYTFSSQDKSSMVNVEFGIKGDRLSLSLFGEFYSYSKDQSFEGDSMGLGLGDTVEASTVGVRFGGSM